MRILLNTLYVTTPESYLALDNETIVLRLDGEEKGRVPLLNLEGIVVFGYVGTSPALMGACAKRGISLSFLTPTGQFLARVTGAAQGNILLRKKQYRVSDDEAESCKIAANMIAAKLHNARWVLERAVRDHAMRVDAEKLKSAALQLAESARLAAAERDLSTLRGIEGQAASTYFGVFNDLILQQQDDFVFRSRNRRPPMDRVNALLSFVYTLLTHEAAAALESVGLDPYAGFMHRDRPGRASLALDLMEDLRAVMADRLVLTLINRKVVTAKGFRMLETGGVLMDDDTRRAVIEAWQARKRETLQHPFLQEKIAWGLVPYAQALLLARHLRGDLESYPPFFWK